MTAIQRNAAALPLGPGKANLEGGGSGRAPLSVRTGRVAPKFRFPADPAAELMPAAEFLGQDPDFAAILEEFEGSPLDPARRRVLGRLMGMFAMDYQGARTEERRFLRRLLAARNAREGYATNRALHLCQVPHAIRRTLALAVAESRRAQGPLAGFLGAVQARMAAATFMLLGPRGRELVWNLLTLAGTHPRVGAVKGADRGVERALVMKALAARRHQLGPWSAKGERALAEVQAFAERIRGVGRAELAALTAPPGLEGITHASWTAAERARAEVDPIFAWERHDARISLAAPEQAESAADDALPDLDRSPLLDRPRLHQALAEARARGEALIPKRCRDALVDYVAGRGLDAEREQRRVEALDILESRGFDVARRDALTAIREDSMGIYRFDAARALGLLLSRYTGATYVRRVFSDQLTAGADPLGQIGSALSNGFAVPIVLSELKRTTTRALTILGTTSGSLHVQVYAPPSRMLLVPQALLSPVLPEQLGRRARADAFMAPAALDLLAPPFGIAFPKLGIEDRL